MYFKEFCWVVACFFLIFWILNKCTNRAVEAVSIPGTPSPSLKLTAHGGKTDGHFLQLKRNYTLRWPQERKVQGIIGSLSSPSSTPELHRWLFSHSCLTGLHPHLHLQSKQMNRSAPLIAEAACVTEPLYGTHPMVENGLMYEIPVASAARRSSYNNVHALQKLKWLTLNFLILHIYLQSVGFITLQFVYPSN